MRSDNTVLTADSDGRLMVYRLRRPVAGGDALEGVRVLSPTAIATWGADPAVYHDATVSGMLKGNPPRSTHAFLGFVTGVAIGAMTPAGPVGWIVGALLGTVVGHVLSTGRSDVHMAPVIQVGG